MGNRFHLHPPHLCPGRSVHVRDNILDLSVILGFIQLPSTPANLTNSLQSAIMSVEIEPTGLAFTRPFTTEVSQSLKIRNSNRTPVAFKVKTTAPKQYCVRPNSGVIQPNATVEVQVLLQAMKEEPPLDYKCRDKFLVQSSILETKPTAEEGLSALWSHIEKTSKGSIQEKKIRV